MLLFRETGGKLFRSMPSGRQRDSWVVTHSDFVYPREVTPAVVSLGQDGDWAEGFMKMEIVYKLPEKTEQIACV